ncbi:PLP-dependent aminotransferase family protein [Rhodoferax saidenbachensis]|uniref:DNA-binding transcriptional MocR family regulator n=1 Tax=Rhodoferax saidenbachensis TaxID=1484693 RepID=A0ABU1ZTK2_9BURK|nr:PLP-dependent aminotransferase family protein [Rhodoferax saidenbachensis]MDR7307861.1 DNA-binding transcriptional MocR family regulator [Rhodoferax saidenbachensis]
MDTALTTSAAHRSPPATEPIYQRLAAHYRGAIQAGSLVVGDRMPSLRSLMRQHEVSLSTAMQLSRQLEGEGWLEARPRSGYFVRKPLRNTLAMVSEPRMDITPDPAQYVGIHARVSDFIARGRLQMVKTNLAVARCAPELYPAEALKLAAMRVLRTHPQLLVSASSPRGNPEFRAVLAKRALSLGVTLSPADVQVTNGCIEALNLALRAVAQPGDTIAVESPTFYGLLQVLEALGFRALEIPTSPQTGISLDALEMAMQTYDNIKAVVVVPHLQNPLGSIMPDAHKQGLVQLCERQGVALIEDDTYSELVNESTRGDTPLRAMKSWDTTGNVIYCASLHKILAPGARVGWMAAGRWQARVEMLKFTQTRSNEELSQLALADYMASPAYDRHLRRLRSTLHVQREKTAQAIASYFPEGTRLNVPDGGLSLWVELPQKLSSRRVFDAALAQQILVTPGQMFSNSLRFDSYLRINCGWPHQHDVEQGLRRLGQIVTALLETQAPT